MMNRMNSGSIISRPAAISASSEDTPASAKRCGQSQRKYSRRYSRRFAVGGFCAAGFQRFAALLRLTVAKTAVTIVVHKRSIPFARRRTMGHGGQLLVRSRAGMGQHGIFCTWRGLSSA